MIVFGVLVVAFVLFFALRRRRRAVKLAGLSSAAPVFSVEPPMRRHSSLKREAL